MGIGDSTSISLNTPNEFYSLQRMRLRGTFLQIFLASVYAWAHAACSEEINTLATTNIFDSIILAVLRVRTVPHFTGD